jgi:ketosteroid isomerase-like protein
LNLDTVLKTHRDIFYKALLQQDWASLANLYADDYTLVRSNGTALTKEEVLTDLRKADLVFKSIELMNERVRLVGSVAILTGESRTIAEREGVAFEARFRLVAVYVEAERGLRLLHFQSTDIPATPNNYAK